MAAEHLSWDDIRLLLAAGWAVPGLRQSGAPVLQREVWTLRNPETGEASAIRTVHDWLVALFDGRSDGNPG